MNLDRLGVFVKILDAGSMNAAARALHLTQPALSHAIKLLEGRSSASRSSRGAGAASS